MPSYVFEKHDIGITRTDGTVVGLMLATDEKNRPLYATSQDKYLSQQYVSSPDYGALDPESEIRIIGDDFRAGFGQRIFNSKDPLRYHKSRGMDGRFAGMFIGGHEPHLITVPTGYTTLTIPNADCEADSTWQGGNRSSDRSGSGTYSWKATGNSFFQDLPNWEANYRNTQMSINCNVWSDGASNISIHDGVGLFYSSNHGGGSVWAILTVERKLNAAATNIRIQGHCPAGSVSYYDDWAFTYQPVDGPTLAYCHATFNDKEYIARGKIIQELTSNGAAFQPLWSRSVNVSCLEKFVDNQLYIAMNTSSAYYEMTTAEGFTVSNAAITYLQYMKTSGPTMFANNSSSVVWSTAAPKAGGTAWGAATTVGAGSDEITALVSKNDEIHIMKEDKPYYIDSSGNVQSNTAPELEALRSATSGKNADVWLDKIYIPVGEQSLREVSADPKWVSPSEFMTDCPEFTGKVQGLAHDDQWQFAVLANTGYGCPVMAGREEYIDGSLRRVWHPIADVPITNCETAWVSSVYKKRLYVSSIIANEGIYALDLYSGYGDVTNDVNARYQTNVWMETPYLHGGFKGDVKGFPELELTMGHVYNSNVYFSANYMKLGDTVWTHIADYKGNATHPIQLNYLPDDASSVHPVTQMIKLKFIVNTAYSDITPQLLSYDLKGWLYPDVRNVIECEVRCADSIRDKQGNLVDDSAKYIREVLEESQDARWPFTLYDLWGDAHTVRVLPTPTFSYATAKKDNENVEERFILRLQEVTVA